MQSSGVTKINLVDINSSNSSLCYHRFTKFKLELCFRRSEAHRFLTINQSRIMDKIFETDSSFYVK